MAAIINALFGTYPDPEQQNTAANHITVEGNNTITTERLHTSAVSDDVHVKSVISTETHANSTINTKLNIDNIISQLNTTHAQVDHYSRARTAEINEQVQKSIGDVLSNTQRLQEELILDANRRHLVLDNDYKVELQKAVETLDMVRAKTLADLEHDLQIKQQIIMADAKRQIDALNDQANAAKLHALVDAQEHAKQDISNLADQVALLGQQDTQNLLESKTTTIITSQTQATGHAEAVIVLPVTDTSTITITDSHTQVAVKSPTEIVPVSTHTTGTAEHATAFGTVTGSSELTTTPATDVTTTTTNTETHTKSTHDNTNF